ncbi:CRAL/TRIO domain-containing protein [Mollisia scopiformis]|uniref:CRAL/TRIO domain-containing protein n=1 Tax=Mollisia scopiformis TaxID=149040 RepID=A0A194WTK1_MOLSC|nr:CRAL/TRIO domain-containing protein [Mollisia scopiformis]KUJ10942.1 CRAL/TRIO domain-containing protein [Mollisia scopiformis]
MPHSIHDQETVVTGVASPQLDQFKSILCEKGLLSSEAHGRSFPHDDESLSRFLSANKFDLKKSVAQFTKTSKWLSDERVQELYSSIDVDYYERARRMYGAWTGRRDRQGNPVYVLQVSKLKAEDIQQCYEEAKTVKQNLESHKDLATLPKMLPIYAVVHSGPAFVLPLCSAVQPASSNKPLTKMTNIIDISGVGLRQWWFLKDHLQIASMITTEYYPDVLDKTIVVGAPSFFPVVWGWFKRWFNAAMLEKTFIVNKSQMRDTLAEHIDPDHFPTTYGGNLEWEYGKINLDDVLLSEVQKDGGKGWIKGPCIWSNGRRVGVGSVNGVKR